MGTRIEKENNETQWRIQKETHMILDTRFITNLVLKRREEAVIFKQCFVNWVFLTYKYSHFSHKIILENINVDFREYKCECKTSNHLEYKTDEYVYDLKVGKKSSF